MATEHCAEHAIASLADVLHVQVKDLAFLQQICPAVCWLVCKECTEAIVIPFPVQVNAGPAFVQVNLEEREIEQLRGQVRHSQHLLSVVPCNTRLCFGAGSLCASTVKQLPLPVSAINISILMGGLHMLPSNHMGMQVAVATAEGPKTPEKGAGKLTEATSTSKQVAT